MNNYYLLGYPIAHSLSPLMMNYSFGALGIDAHYSLKEATPETLASVIQELKTDGASGWNVTMPCKNAMLGFCDELAPASRIGGSVNTVLNRNGRLYGATTDGIGFMNAAAAAGFPLKGKKLTLLGTGGAASAILIQAALDGVSEIAVFWNRPASRLRLEEIAGKLSGLSQAKIIPCSYEIPGLLLSQISESSALVNATNIGMAGTERPDACLIPDASYLRRDLFVYDIIYHPEKTPLLRMAEEAGCPCENGLSMLIGQGAESFRIWTGETMPEEEVRRQLLASF